MLDAGFWILDTEAAAAAVTAVVAAAVAAVVASFSLRIFPYKMTLVVQTIAG